METVLNYLQNDSMLLVYVFGIFLIFFTVISFISCYACEKINFLNTFTKKINIFYIYLFLYLFEVFRSTFLVKHFKYTLSENIILYILLPIFIFLGPLIASYVRSKFIKDNFIEILSRSILFSFTLLVLWKNLDTVSYLIITFLSIIMCDRIEFLNKINFKKFIIFIYILYFVLWYLTKGLYYLDKYTVIESIILGISVMTIFTVHGFISSYIRFKYTGGQLTEIFSRSMILAFLITTLLLFFSSIKLLS
jgi:hypothetical protein